MAFSNRDFSISCPTAAILAGEWSKRSVLVQAQVFNIVKHHSQMLLTQIQSHASGRPGPNAPTGDYRRSWNIRYNLAHQSGDVGTNKPQGRRLEWGFIGADSLGRHYNQPPFPHVAPSVAVVEPQFHLALEAYVNTL
jgi:hypothetical protein